MPAQRRLRAVRTVPRETAAASPSDASPDFPSERKEAPRLYVLAGANGAGKSSIAGGSGLRKLRWSVQGRGKRGGARVIYYRHVPGDRIYLIYAYVKNEQSDLTREQIKLLSQLMKDIKNG